MREMIEPLKNLKRAYYEVLEAWENVDLNETKSIEKYPFERSFDQLGLVEWIEATIEELEGGEIEVIEYEEEFVDYLAEIFEYNEDWILEVLQNEQLYKEWYEEFLKQR